MPTRIALGLMNNTQWMYFKSILSPQDVMLGNCGGSVWVDDEFTSCFMAEYLETLLPLIFCLVSLLYLAIRAAVCSHYIGSKKDAISFDPNTRSIILSGRHSGRQSPQGLLTSVVVDDNTHDIEYRRESADFSHKPPSSIDHLDWTCASEIFEGFAILGEFALSGVKFGTKRCFRRSPTMDLYSSSYLSINHVRQTSMGTHPDIQRTQGFFVWVQLGGVHLAAPFDYPVTLVGTHFGFAAFQAPFDLGSSVHQHLFFQSPSDRRAS